jgi:nitrate reductase NapE component
MNEFELLAFVIMPVVVVALGGVIVWAARFIP